MDHTLVSQNKRASTCENTVRSNLECRKDGLLGIWRDLISEPVWKYQELPPFLLPELTTRDLIQASDSELSRAMWFWLRRPKLAPHESATLIVWTLCVLLCLTIALVDWPFTSMLNMQTSIPPLPLKGDTKMKTTNLKQTNVAKPRKWFQRRRRWHDPMLVLNMSIFNSGSGWYRILYQLPSHENVWG
jgi:hypothetical protein